MNEPAADLRIRVHTAKAMRLFNYKKLGEGGRKEHAGKKAEGVASRFGKATAPSLAAAGDKKIRR